MEEKLHSNSRLRRFGLAVGGGLLAASAVLYGASFYNQSDQRSAIETIDPNSPEGIIMAEVNKLEINPDQDEQNHWKNPELAYQLNAHTSNKFSDLETGREALKRFAKTADLMIDSKNEVFNEAEGVIRQYLDLELVGLEAVSDGSDNALSFKAGFNEDDVFMGVISINTDFALNRSNSLIMAGQMTALASTVDKIMQFVLYDLDRDLNPAEKTARIRSLEGNPKIRARAYAYEAEAYIREVGLLGEAYSVPTSGIKQRTAKYIEYGKDPNDPRWIEYIRSSNSISLPVS